MAARALAPLARLSAASRAIDVADLAPAPARARRGRRTGRGRGAFNDTLARLEHAVGDMRQFSTALAHELRTPLAALRGEAELALQARALAEEYRRGLADQLEELDGWRASSASC